MIPWQVTGNHWLSIPCIHPADGSIHSVGVISQAVRAAIELAGGADFLDAAGTPLLRTVIEIDGVQLDLAAGRMAWQRVLEWLPAFNTTAGDILVRGAIFAPAGRAADFPGFVYALSLENRGDVARSVSAGFAGNVSHRQLRVRTPRQLDGSAHAACSR